MHYFNTVLKLDYSIMDCNVCAFGTENATLLRPNESNGNTRNLDSSFMNVLNHLNILNTQDTFYDLPYNKSVIYP